VVVPSYLLADAALPPLSGHQFFSTEFDAVPIVLIVGALVGYIVGVRRVRRLHPRHPWPLGRTVAWVGALVVTGIAIFSFIGVYDGELFYDHMVQHLLLIMVAAPLYALGAPLKLAWWSTDGRAHQLVTKALRSSLARLLDHPLVAFALYAVMIPVTHLTSLYNLTLEHEEIHNLEHLLFLVIGYLFWRQIFTGEFSAHRVYPGLRLALLAFAIPVDTFTGLSLASSTHEIFPAYLTLHRTWGPSRVADLHDGGVIMWVGGDTLMFLPMIPLALQWMHYEERRARRVDRELDAMLPARRGVGGEAALTD
jgi:cytochrome c oxidase assembly factor CtaG